MWRPRRPWAFKAAFDPEEPAEPLAPPFLFGAIAGASDRRAAGADSNVAARVVHAAGDEPAGGRGAPFAQVAAVPVAGFRAADRLAGGEVDFLDPGREAGAHGADQELRIGLALRVVGGELSLDATDQRSIRRGQR